MDADLHAPLYSDVPVLLLSGEADPVTPPADAERAARGLERRRLLVLAGEGHGQLATGCVPRLMAQFLDLRGSGRARRRLSGPASRAAVFRPPDRAGAVIEAHALCKRFGAIQAVREASFTAGDGRITGLLGPNGAGKSTSLRMLYGVLTPDSGRASIDGIDIRGETSGARARLGVLPHAAGLYGNLTARENVAYFGALHGLAGARVRARTAQLVRELDMGEFIDRRAKGLSQGQRIKVALARALVHEPRNLILDEPTNGLDVMAIRSLREMLAGLRRAGHCILLSSHVMQEIAALCDRVVVIGHGRVIAEDTPEGLRARSAAATLEEAFVHLLDGGA